MLRVALLKTRTASIGSLKSVKSRDNNKWFRLYSTNSSIQEWCDSLDEAQQKRIRHVQNEVRPIIIL